MRNKKPIYTAFAGILVAACAAMISSCGESTNIKASTPTTAATCDDLGIDCSHGRFVDDSVSNLNFNCGSFTGVTGFDGSYSCPLNSQVRFYIRNPDNGVEINIGSTTARNLAASNVKDFLYITPVTLYADPVAQNNLVRFLQSLSRHEVPAGSPDHIIILDDADKKKITFAINPSDFSKPPSDFEAFVKPYFDSLNPAVTMISSAKADEYLRNAINSTVAGVYTVPGALTSSSVTGGLSGSNSINKLIGSVWNIVDRKGRMMGGGVYSYESSSSSQLIYTNVKPMEFASLGLPTAQGFYTWPTNGSMVGMLFNMNPTVGSVPTTTQKLTFTSGIMDRGVIAASNEIYKIYFGDAAAPTLGRWKMTDSLVPANDISEDNDVTIPGYTLIRAVPAAPTLNPDYWRPIARAGKFPLNLSIKFYDNDNSAACTDAAGNIGCQIGTSPIRITILSDGNIVSDRNGDCNKDLDPKTLNNTGSTAAASQEVPLGLVRDILSRPNAANEVYMTLIFLIPPTADFPADLRYAQAITNLSRAPNDSTDKPPVVQLRVDGDESSNTSYLHFFDVSYNDDAGGWLNLWRLYQSVDPSASPADKAANGKKSQGRMVSRPVAAADCPI